MHWAIDAVNFQYIGPKLAVNFQHTGVASRGIIAVNPAETRGFAAVVISLARASIPLKGAAGRNRLRTRPLIGALLQTPAIVRSLLQLHCTFVAASVPVYWKFLASGNVDTRAGELLQTSVLEIPRQWN